MTIRTPLARAIRLAIGGAAGLSAALAAPLTLAQDDQTVYVVGSRIGRSADCEGPSPVLTVDRAAIENSGYDNLQQLLEKPAACRRDKAGGQDCSCCSACSNGHL